MEYDFRTYESNASSAYNRPPPSSSAMYGQPPSLYPKIGGSAAGSTSHGGRNPPSYHPPPPPGSPGSGIRVAIKPEYRITPPPRLLPQLGEIPRSNFHVDFEFERNVLIEAAKENPNWSRLGIEIATPKASETTPPYGAKTDPVLSKYIASGLNREAVPLAVANFGDNPAKVKEFANGFTLLREMGFSSNNIAEALLMYDNDKDKALAYLLNNTS